MIEFEKEVRKLVDLNLWVETDYPISHKFSNVRFISYAKPIPNTTFWLGGKKWKSAGIRNFKPKQYINEVYIGPEGLLHNVEIKLSEYRLYQKIVDKEKEEA